MSLEILKAGVLDTVQDIGRQGYSKWGIPPGGVMDRFASQVANALVGNGPDAGVIEMHFPAARVLFQRDALVSITGAEMAPALQGREIECWKPVIVKAGNVLTFQRRIRGARCYLAVRGGVDVAPWLQSRSTNMKINAGGFHGRALQRGDLIPVCDDPFPKEITGEFKMLPWTVNHHRVYANRDEIYFTTGHEWNWLSESSRRDLLTHTFMIEGTSDRMAYHLRHPALAFLKNQDQLSCAVCAGTIQAVPAGNLLILMADHQTTGGYPRIGHVSSAHLPKLAQLNAGEVFRLKEISMEDSEKMLLSLGRDLRDIQTACRKNLQEYEALN